jgi:hypothetical protein
MEMAKFPCEIDINVGLQLAQVADEMNGGIEV